MRAFRFLRYLATNIVAILPYLALMLVLCFLFVLCMRYPTQGLLFVVVICVFFVLAELYADFLQSERSDPP